MIAQERLAEQFEVHRQHLLHAAYRMLGSLSEAEDAVQEGWLRLCRAETEAIENLGGWLTRVVSRVCLDMLRSRKSRREEPLDTHPAGTYPLTEDGGGPDPEREALMAESVGVALLVVLDRLKPAERVTFVLHDIFGMPFAEIAQVAGKSEAAVRQLASRARRRVTGTAPRDSADLAGMRRLVDAFIAAARGARPSRAVRPGAITLLRDLPQIEDRDLRPVAQPQLAENFGDVILHRAFAQEKRLRNLTVRQPVGNLADDPLLGVGQAEIGQPLPPASAAGRSTAARPSRPRADRGLP